MTLPTEPMTGIVIPVREADTLVRSRVMQIRPTLLPRDRSLIAHITLLAPFFTLAEIDDALLHRLTRFFSDVTPFGYSLTEVCAFPSGIAYLAPEPAASFRKLTQELHHEFPEFPPYGGAFDEIVPHLTVPLPPGEDVETLTAALATTLPIHTQAVEAVLMHVEEDNTHVIATLPFGTTAA